MESLKIVLLSIAAAVTYGVLHDQVTARVCVEYFTIGHPPIFNTNSPTLLALGWGVIATWWMGLLLGIPCAAAARVGSLPKTDAAQLIRPIGILLVVMGCISLAAGLAGHEAASAGVVSLVEPLESSVPAEKHIAFITDLWAHLAAYATGFFGGLALCVWVLVGRFRRAPQPSLDAGKTR